MKLKTEISSSMLFEMSPFYFIFTVEGYPNSTKYYINEMNFKYLYSYKR